MKELIEQLEEVPSLQRLRFHSRFPVGIPERIDREFLEILSQSRFQTFFVVHCNHPKELDEDFLQAMKEIQKLGIPVMNQAVLLRGVNSYEG